MRVSSFCGAFSLRTGAVVIGLYHVISAPLLLIYFHPTGFRHDQWHPIFALLFLSALLLLFGIVRRNVDNVFPFVCLQFTATSLFIYHTVWQLINLATWYGCGVNITLILCEILIAALMMFFLTVITSFYQDLVYERNTSSSSIDNGVEPNGAQRCKNILNHLEFQQKISENSDKVAVIQCEDSLQ